MLIKPDFQLTYCGYYKAAGNSARLKYKKVQSSPNEVNYGWHTTITLFTQKALLKKDMIGDILVGLASSRRTRKSFPLEYDRHKHSSTWSLDWTWRERLGKTLINSPLESDYDMLFWRIVLQMSLRQTEPVGDVFGPPPGLTPAVE